jgi:MoxR-like ATPase
LRRLQDAQDPRNQDARAVYPYIDLEPLGHAIQDGKPCVVLIDEIDKADIDFPNDLLDVLDRFEFDIEDLPRSEDAACRAKHGFGRHVQTAAGGARPIVLITSNREKQLPEPFLRRCLYLQLDFPGDTKLLGKIVKKNLAAGPDQISDELLEGVVARFLEVRAHGSDMKKPPATSELLDWVRVLHWQGRSADAVSADQLSEIDQAVLFKLRKDIESYRARVSKEDASGD